MLKLNVSIFSILLFGFSDGSIILQGVLVPKSDWDSSAVKVAINQGVYSFTWCKLRCLTDAECTAFGELGTEGSCAFAPTKKKFRVVREGIQTSEELVRIWTVGLDIVATARAMVMNHSPKDPIEITNPVYPDLVTTIPPMPTYTGPGTISKKFMFPHPFRTGFVICAYSEDLSTAKVCYRITVGETSWTPIADMITGVKDSFDNYFEFGVKTIFGGAGPAYFTEAEFNSNARGLVSYNHGTDKWTVLTNLPINAYGMGMATIGPDLGVIFGGWITFAGATSNVYTYNLTTNSFNTVTSAMPSTGMMRQNCEPLILSDGSNVVLCVGGQDFNRDFVNHAYIYNVADGTHERKAEWDLPAGARASGMNGGQMIKLTNGDLVVVLTNRNVYLFNEAGPTHWEAMNWPLTSTAFMSVANQIHPYEVLYIETD